MYAHMGLGYTGTKLAPQDDPAALMGQQGKMPAQQPVASTAATGSSAGEIMQGIGAILAPLAQAGVSIYAAEQQRKHQKDLEKAQRRFAAQQPVYLPPPPPQRSPALMIVLALVGIGIVGMIMFMMTRGGGSAATVTAPSSPLIATPQAPRIKRVRRVRKRKRPRRRKK